MSNTPRFGRHGRALVILAAAIGLGWASVASARVDETQPELEGHLTGPTVKKLGEPLTILAKYRPQDAGGFGQGRGNGGHSGIIYVMDGFDFQLIDNLVRQAEGEEPATPDAQGAVQSSEFPMHNYFKTDDGSSAQVVLQKPKYEVSGWELQVYMYKGVSVLEIYRRIKTPISDGEISLLLEANRGPSKWENASVAPATWEQKGDSFLGYDYVRDDGKVRALKKGNDLVVFSAGLDKRLADMMDKARSVQNASTKGTAPVSVRGF